MLTRTDLKQIGSVVKTEIKQETKKVVRDETGKIITKGLKPIRKDVGSLKDDVAQIRKDIKTIVNFFDREYLELRARVDRIEEHLKLEPMSF